MKYLENRSRISFEVNGCVVLASTCDTFRVDNSEFTGYLRFHITHPRINCESKYDSTKRLHCEVY